MFQVKVLIDKTWKALLNDCITRGTIVPGLQYDGEYMNITTYKDAADLYDFVLREFHQGTLYDNLLAVKFVEILPNGREWSVFQYKDLVRRK